MSKPTDTQAIDTIVDILNEDDQWDFDHLDAIATVLDAVRDRPRGDSNWIPEGEPLVWTNRGYVADGESTGG